MHSPAPLALALLLAAGSAGAADEDAAPPAAPAAAYTRGEVLPLGLRAERGEAAFVTATGGYDGARKAGTLDVAAELHVFGPVTLRGGASYVSSADALKPSLGALVQLFGGGDWVGSAGVFYKPEGLTEPEGELEAVFAIGLRLERATLVANLTYGQDPEGNERDGEVRLGGATRIARNVLVGADARLRFAIGGARKGEPDADLVAGPVASLIVADTAFTVQAGVGAVKVASLEAGPVVLLGIGRLF